MDFAHPAPRPFGHDGLPAIPYDDTQAANPSVLIRTPSSPFDRPGKKSSALQQPSAASSPQLSSPATPPKINSYVRRDSELAPSTVATVRDSRTTFTTYTDSVPSPKVAPSPPSPPTSPVPEDPLLTLPETNRRWGISKGRAQGGNGLLSPSSQKSFERITTEIPTGSLDDLTTPGEVEFSNRGSMLLGGKKVTQANGHPFSHSREIGTRSLQNVSVAPRSVTIPPRIISVDDEAVSQKVRSMYEAGTDRGSDTPDQRAAQGRGHPRKSQKGFETAHLRPTNASSTAESEILADENLRQTRIIQGERKTVLVRDANELAGGMEDWEDLDGSDVDRYGFIVPKSLSSPGSGKSVAVDIQRVQRVTTSLKVASEAPRRHRSTVRRNPSTTRSTPDPGNASSRSLRPNSRNSQHGSLGGVPSKIRVATNRLPHNKDRRAMDEAADMLTLPPGLANIAEDVCIKAASETRRKEREREDKWRKMAKVVNNRRDGGGMMFEFDTSDPRLVERTWKGIPDRWRATAWHAFMTASAKKHAGSPTDEELIAIFHELVEQSSPDDFQIDLDVPRTINSHIMFRRRYRGGQRLLFRVLHCLSIYFPDTGYVQGMAALVATLLCYFDEEMAFVMIVRLWQLRGLKRLYQPEFEGLMQALDEFEKKWLRDSEIAKRMVSWSTPDDRTRHFLALLIRLGSTDKSQRHAHSVWHPMVPDPVQLLHSFPCAAPHLGCFHAPGRP